MNKWSYFYHPTTLTFIDDELVFLDTLKLYFSKNYHTQFFNNPKLAQNKINENPVRLYYRPKIECDVNDCQFNADEQQSMVAIDWNAIFNALFNKKRSFVDSVLIVDYSMPEMNGLELCYELRKSPIKKILLTGHDDLNTALNAFNAGIINAYVNKKDENVLEVLTDKIVSLQNRFFKDFVKQNFGNLLDTIVPKPVIHFYEWVKTELCANEYYLIDKNGSTIFINEKNEQFILNISNTGQLEQYANIAFDQDEKILADHLRSGKKMIYFPNELSKYEAAVNWEKYLHDGTPIPKANGYFYSIIKMNIKSVVDI